MASHMASHRGLAGKNCVPTFRSRSCCNVSTPLDTLQRLRGAALHFDKDPFEAPAEVKYLVVWWTFGTNENKKAPLGDGKKSRLCQLHRTTVRRPSFLYGLQRPREQRVLHEKTGFAFPSWCCFELSVQRSV